MVKDMHISCRNRPTHDYIRITAGKVRSERQLKHPMSGFDSAEVRRCRTKLTIRSRSVTGYASGTIGIPDGAELVAFAPVRPGITVGQLATYHVQQLQVLGNAAKIP